MGNDISVIFNHFSDLVIALGGILGTIYAMSKKFRGWVNGKLKDTDSIKDLNKETASLREKTNTMADTCDVRSKELTNICKKMEGLINKLEGKIEKDKESTILTLKYEILDICSRAERYHCITHIDKELLCELYHEYVEVWKENHYVKSEADKVINTYDVVDKYVKIEEVE